MVQQPSYENMVGAGFAAVVLAMIMCPLTIGCKNTQQTAKAEEQQLRRPRVTRPWKEALRLVGDGKTLCSDFALIQDKVAQWHGIREENMVSREDGDRDFCVFWDARLGEYLMYYYCGAAAGPGVRTSRDLLHWSEAATVLQAPPKDPHGYGESPFVLYRDGYYYLWVSGIDYSHTHVYISEDPFNFGDAIANSIEEEPGHAPEIVSDKGMYCMACSMVSTVPSATPAVHNLEGILVQPLRWDNPEFGREARVTRKR